MKQIDDTKECYKVIIKNDDTEWWHKMMTQKMKQSIDRNWWQKVMKNEDTKW